MSKEKQGLQVVELILLGGNDDVVIFEDGVELILVACWNVTEGLLKNDRIVDDFVEAHASKRVVLVDWSHLIEYFEAKCPNFIGCLLLFLLVVRLAAYFDDKVGNASGCLTVYFVKLDPLLEYSQD